MCERTGREDLPMIENNQSNNLLNSLMQELIENKLLNKNDVKDKKITIAKDILDIILEKYKSNEYIGVGVGGVYINCNIVNSTDEYVLLYKRYHEPENQKWSIIGGSGEMYELIEDTLKRKFSKITGIQPGDITIKDLIRVNNHKIDEKYHYLSPSYYIDIKNVSAFLYWKKDKNTDERKYVRIASSGDELQLFSEKSTKENIQLAWVKTNLITNDNFSCFFTYTTIKAIGEHIEIKKSKKELQAYLDNFFIKKEV